MLHGRPTSNATQVADLPSEQLDKFGANCQSLYAKITKHYTLAFYQVIGKQFAVTVVPTSSMQPLPQISNAFPPFAVTIVQTSSTIQQYSDV
jgi:hypothetical protein